MTIIGSVTASITAPPLQVFASFRSQAQSIRKRRLTQAQRIAEKQKWLPEFVAEVPRGQHVWTAAVSALEAGDPEPLFQALDQFGPLSWGALLSASPVPAYFMDGWLDLQLGIHSPARDAYIRLCDMLAHVGGGNFPRSSEADFTERRKQQRRKHQHEHRTRAAVAKLADTPKGAQRQALLTAWEHGKNAANHAAAVQWRHTGKQI